MIIYRILSFIVTIFCSFLAMITMFGIFIAFTNPAVLFQSFLLAGVVLYGWFSNKFFGSVIIKKEKMPKKQKDWLQVNAIVAFAFSLLSIISCITLIAAPEQLTELISTLPEEAGITAEKLLNIAYGLLALCSVLFAHIIWTYLLIRKHSAYFEG